MHTLTSTMVQLRAPNTQQPLRDSKAFPCTISNTVTLGAIARHSTHIKRINTHAPQCVWRTRRALAPTTLCRAATKLDSAARWWESQADLWLEAHTEEEFWKHIDDATEQLVFVDFYATWCQGCQSIYPDLCKLARDPQYAHRVRFVKVCVEELKTFTKDIGVKAMPYVQLYRPGNRQALVGFQAVPSRVKAIRTNVDTVLNAPPQGKYFRLDPNGFVLVTDVPPPSAGTKAAQLAALKASSSGLFSHLMNVAAAPSTATTTPASTTSTTTTTISTTTPTPPSTSTTTTTISTTSTTTSTTSTNAKQAFLQQYGSDYGYGGRIDTLYPEEIGSRLPAGHHYLDYTGSSLYSNSQLEAVFAELKSHVFGNPHSLNPSSELTGDKVEEIRDMVRNWFHAPMSDYQVVFTKSATDSLKLVGETFPWSEESMFRYLRVNHNSVLGIRQYALEHGAQYMSVEEPWVQQWLRDDDTQHQQAQNGAVHAAAQQQQENGVGVEVGGDSDKEKQGMSYSLFAFPAEDNFAGVKYPLDWIKQVQSRSTSTHQWKVLVDAAAFVPTQPLDLRTFPADFVSISFYKMFGYPTGLGALLIRTENVQLLRKVFWGGGSVSLAVAGDNFRVLQCEPTSRLEDGTVAFLDIISLKHGFTLLQSLGGMSAIQAHVRSLTAWTYTQLHALYHSNGAPVVQIFGRHGAPDAAHTQGGILNFELLQPDGVPFSYREIQEASAAAGFHLRTGSECNPGACYSYLGLTEAEVETLAEDKEGCGDEVEWITVKRAVEDETGAVHSKEVLPLLQKSKLELGHAGEIAMKWVRKPLGTVRVSLGYMSTFEDVSALVGWVRDTYTDRTDG